jgi:hypothetical protein
MCHPLIGLSHVNQPIAQSTIHVTMSPAQSHINICTTMSPSQSTSMSSIHTATSPSVQLPHQPSCTATSASYCHVNIIHTATSPFIQCHIILLYFHVNFCTVPCQPFCTVHVYSAMCHLCIMPRVTFLLVHIMPENAKNE